MDATNLTQPAEPADTEAASLLTEMRNGYPRPQSPREHQYSSEQMQSNQMEPESPWWDSVFVQRKDDVTTVEHETPEERQNKDLLGTQIWKFYHDQKGQLPNRERLENLTWRMMSMNLRRKEMERRGILARSQAQTAPSGIAQLRESSQHAKDGWDQLVQEFHWMDYKSPAKLKPQPASALADAVPSPNYSPYFVHPTAAEEVSPTSPFVRTLPDSRLNNSFGAGGFSLIQAFGHQRDPTISTASELGHQDATHKLKDRISKLERLLESVTTVAGADKGLISFDADADVNGDGDG